MLKEKVLCLFAACSIAANAQNVNLNSKFGMELQQHLGMNVNHSEVLTRGETPKVRVLVSLVPAAGITAADLEAVGCEVKWTMKSQALVIVAVDQLEALAAIPGVRNIDLPKKVELQNDIARGVVHVDEVADPKSAVAAGLPQGYDGTGVLVGILDTGIDFKHYAFRDEEGNLRLQKTWTQRNIIGREDDLYFTAHSDPDDILSVKPLASQEHGSHVLGIMAGQELGNNLHGMAPKTDILAADFETFDDGLLVEGMKYMCEYAEENHKPIAINMSLGVNEGWADGCDPVAEAVMELTDNGTKPGVIFSLAAGNEGNYNNWVIHKFTSDDEKIFVISEPGSEEYEYEGHNVICLQESEKIHVWTDRLADNKEEMLAVFDLDKKEMVEDPDTIIGIATVTKTIEDGVTKYHLIDPASPGLLDKIPITLRSLRDLLKQDGLYSSSIHTCADGKTQKNEMWYHIKSGHHVRLFKHLRIGACFSYPAGTEIRVGSFANKERHGRFIKPDGFDCAKESSNNGSLNISTCNEVCIAVGSYSTRDTYTNVFGYESVDERNVVNDVSAFSSYGYTFNEQHLAKPEVLAPGSLIQSSINNLYNKYFTKEYGVLPQDIDYYVKEPITAGKLSSRVNINGQDYWYVYNQGTSMATPVVTGIIALWLQANPNLSAADVREIIAHTSMPFVSPNKDYDPLKSSVYGIINALEGLKYINSMTGISTLSDSQQHDSQSTSYNLFGQPAKGPGFVVRDGRVVLVK